MKSKKEVVEYINTKLQEYEGYVQFSHRPLDKERDLFYNEKKVEVQDEEGFIYEAHFCNGKTSVTIKQINDGWSISKTDISDVPDSDIESYISKVEGFNYKVKMAQIWESEPDPLCEGMDVKKLKKVVFAGFEKGGKR